MRHFPRFPSSIGLVCCLVMLAGCARGETRRLTATAYCGCGVCNGYTRGHWYLLKLDIWNRTIRAGAQEGQPYSGRTASGDRLRLPHPGLVSLDTLRHPWMLPMRAVLPWLWLQQDGTIAADTDDYPFGTRMYVPGYGWGSVQDRGSAIQGPQRIDLYMWSHGRALKWGRKNLQVTIVKR
jgi:3D (Asp-Asp-Asp) domain-containing protein